LGSSLPPAELARRDSGVFEKIKCLFSFTLKVRRSGEVVRVFLTEKHSTDVGRDSDRRWRCVCRLSLEDGLRRRGVRRAGVCTTDTDISVCLPRAAEAAKALAATDAEPCLSLVRQARLSATRRKGALCVVFVGATDTRPRRIGRVCRVVTERVEASRPLKINGSYLKWDTWQRSTAGGTGATDVGCVCRRSDRRVCRS
jgi:hypothetical protein